MADPAASPPALIAATPGETQAAAPPLRVEIPVSVPSTQKCDAVPADEIVVCAPDSSVYRLGPSAVMVRRPLPKAEIKLSGNASIAAQLQSGSLGNTPTNRAMVAVTVAF